MATITVDGKNISCGDRDSILQACLDNGIDIPHYCYHPALSVPASCRICLVDIEGQPKLNPACRTPVRDGMIVYTDSPKSVANQKQIMEYLLLSHPLDCPVCDKAGECLLQDYSYDYGRSISRFEEVKVKNPKKVVGDRVMLYTDRCILCTRCVRFTREVTGTGELFVNGRGSTEEIEIFPGKGLNNPLSLNVIDICPVGALLDRDFLFKQRVWLLKKSASISPVDAGGENISLHHNEGVIYRVRPRFNKDVNTWWISDDSRYSYRAVASDRRLKTPTLRQHGVPTPTTFDAALEAARHGLEHAAQQQGEHNLFAVLSPMLATEEAYLIADHIRSLDSQATLVMGPVVTGVAHEFKNPETGKTTFTIDAEKVPNRRGVEKVLAHFGGHSLSWDDFAADTSGTLRAGIVTGNYLSPWLAEMPAVLRDAYVVAMDTLANPLTESPETDVVIPVACWAETEGTWINNQDLAQRFFKAVDAPTGVRSIAQLAQKLNPGVDDSDQIHRKLELSPQTPTDVDHDEPAFEYAEL